MALLDIFSKRQRRLRGEVPDVYVYDDLPAPLRVQCVHVIQELLGEITREALFTAPHRLESYRFIVDALCREHGIFRLPGKQYEDREYPVELFNFLLQTSDVEEALDVIELSLRYADRITRTYNYLGQQDFNEHVDSRIAEVNARFREHGVGFQYEDGELVRLDSDLLHSDAVKPALTLLRTKAYAGPREEFLRAHEHYRHGRHEEALNEALKSFESTMKAICKAKGWACDANATAKTLVNVCMQNGLVDPFWQSHFSALRATLENGIATARNKLSGHGQGADPREVPRELVAYVMHMTASTIVFLIESAG